MPVSRYKTSAIRTVVLLTLSAAIGGNGGALRQALLNQEYPDGQVEWGGRTLPSKLLNQPPQAEFMLTYPIVNSMLLDVTGILFAAQLVTLLSIGPYADYGNWRPWIMIGAFRHIVSKHRLTQQNSWPRHSLYLPVCHVWHEQARAVANCAGSLRCRLSRYVPLPSSIQCTAQLTI